MHQCFLLNYQLTVSRVQLVWFPVRGPVVQLLLLQRRGCSQRGQDQDARRRGQLPQVPGSSGQFHRPAFLLYETVFFCFNDWSDICVITSVADPDGGILISRIRMFLGLPDLHPDPSVISTDPATDPAPDPSIIKQK
jgi:hypothetical protein